MLKNVVALGISKYEILPQCKYFAKHWKVSFHFSVFFLPRDGDLNNTEIAVCFLSFPLILILHEDELGTKAKIASFGPPCQEVFGKTPSYYDECLQ